MDEILRRVLDAADYEAQSLANQINRLQSELEEKQAELDAINLKLQAARSATQRRKMFIAQQGIDYFCPRCDFRFGRRTKLTNKPSNTPEDIFECDTCGLSV